jgi:hypothetical protein
LGTTSKEIFQSNKAKPLGCVLLVLFYDPPGNIHSSCYQRLTNRPRVMNFLAPRIPSNKHRSQKNDRIKIRDLSEMESASWQHSGDDISIVSAVLCDYSRKLATSWIKDTIPLIYMENVYPSNLSSVVEPVLLGVKMGRVVVQQRLTYDC